MQLVYLSHGKKPALEQREQNMNTENINAAAAMPDEDLAKVTGGEDWLQFSQTGKYYKWNGPADAYNGKYLCPRCKRPVHFGAGFRFYCDPCDCSWWFETMLLPDPSSGNWEEITRDEYYELKNGTSGR